MKRLTVLFALCVLFPAAAVPNPSVHCVRFDGSQHVDTGLPDISCSIRS